MSRAMSLPTAAIQVGDLAWRQAIRSKLLIGVGLVIAFATAIALLIRLEGASGTTPAQDYQALQIVLLSTVVVPLVSLLLGTSAMATERENGTLAYLFTRPFPRAAVVLGKGAAAILVANAATLLCALLVFAASGFPANAQLGGGLAGLMLEATALTAVFVLFGTLMSRSLYLGLAYVVLVEGVLGNFIAARSGFTVTYHARNILSEWSANAARSNNMIEAMPGSAGASVLALLVITAAALAAACAWVERREYGLRDKPKEE